MGTLYLVPTPIGNLEDMSFRAIRILKSAAVIGAEDTRNSGILLKHFEIETPMQSFHMHNEQSRGEEFIRRLQGGEDVAIISDAGMPGISDPGALLVARCVEEGIDVVALPGANAAVTALVASGVNASSFLFYGFLQRGDAKRKAELLELSGMKYPVIIYESPKRILRTLMEISAQMGERYVVVARELSKMYEEYIRGNVSEVIAHFEVHEPLGEMVLIVMPSDEEVTYTDEFLLDEMNRLVAEGMKKRAAAGEVARRYELSKNDLYKLLIGESDE